MKFKNFIWDFDGTLVESYYHTTQALMETLEKYGIEADRKEAEQTLRISFGSAKQKYNLTAEQFKEFMEKALTLWFEPNPYVYEGLEEVLSQIVKKGGKNFVYTNRDNTAIEYLEHFGLSQYFAEYVTTESEFYARKPSGEPIRHLISAHNLKAEETAMVGDRELDILCGKEAGIAGILFDDFDKGKETAAEIRVRKIPEIANYIK